MEERFCHPVPETATPFDIVRWTRYLHPAHYTLKIDSFSLLLQTLQKIGANCYDSDIFEACGYKWKLSLYPNGDKERNGIGYISLYLVVEETSALPLAWEINANFKFFVLDQIRDEYMIIQDGVGKMRRFHEMKKEWGFPQLLPQSSFEDFTKGYLYQDKCAFGVEIFVNTCTGRGECLSLPMNPSSSYTYTLKVNDYFTVMATEYRSPSFTMGIGKWEVFLYYKGNGQGGKSLSMYLQLAESKTASRLFAQYKLCIKDQKNQKQKERTGQQWFRTGCLGWGWPYFMNVNDLENASHGYIVNDTLVLQVEITEILIVKNFSKCISQNL